MKKNKENHPLDDLFVHKLGNLSIPPSKDGFERLQARMNQRALQPKLVVWRRPVVQRYMAVAACLLLFCLFGWLYWSDASKSDSQVAIGHTHHFPIDKKNRLENDSKEVLAKMDRNSLSKTFPTKIPAGVAAEPEDNFSTDAQVAQQKIKARSTKQVVRTTIGNMVEVKPMLAQTRLIDINESSNRPINSDVITPPVQRLAENSSKVSPPTERVLVVTIEEPAVLVAARQEKNSAIEKVAQTTDEKDLKEMKGSGIWQQVKRLKQGELFAQSDNVANEDHGLLSRAYSGLKQSFDKVKSTKQ